MILLPPHQKVLIATSQGKDQSFCYCLLNVCFFGPKWHSLRSLPFQGPKSLDLQGSPLPIARILDLPASKILSPNAICKNRYIGNLAISQVPSKLEITSANPPTTSPRTVSARIKNITHGEGEGAPPPIPNYPYHHTITYTAAAKLMHTKPNDTRDR